MDTDIGVLEYEDHNGQWQILAYIGPDRSGGLVEDHAEGGSSYRGCQLRIRYLDRP